MKGLVKINMNLQINDFYLLTKGTVYVTQINE